MAIISNGVTDIDLQFADEKMIPSIDKVNKKSSGGDLKQQVGGERFKLKVKARVTPIVFRSLIDMLKDGSEQYFYTPQDEYVLYSSVTKPIPVQVDKLAEDWDNRNVYYITFTVESTSYL